MLKLAKLAYSYIPRTVWSMSMQASKFNFKVVMGMQHW